MIPKKDIDAYFEKLKKDAEAKGYHLNPDQEFAKALAEGLLINEKRYGYQSCPCRLSAGSREADADIICPCDYRDDDLSEFDACFCALYVSKKVADKKVVLKSIPERRKTNVGSKAADKKEEKSGAQFDKKLSFPVWRCRVCGYLCARETPPETCPICKVGKERFERFM